jgi:hypothetical protein
VREIVTPSGRSSDDAGLTRNRHGFARLRPSSSGSGCPPEGSLYTSAMSRAVLERRLDALVARRRALRDELAVVDEQLAALADAAGDARLRALVSETPQADVEHRDASRSADAMARHRSVILADLDALDRSEDELLDRLAAEARAR